MADDFEYSDPAGTRYVGHLAVPRAPNGAGVLIAHAAPGIGDHERAVADRLAERGYTVLAADYHGDGKTLDSADMMQRVQALSQNPAIVRAALEAALAALGERAGVDKRRIAAIGYCFGGFAALELARGGADVAAVATFHSSLPVDRPEDARRIKGKLLVLNGTVDPYIPAEMQAAFVKQMDDAGVDWRMTLFGGTQHAYTMQGVEALGIPGMAYHPLNDARAWRAMLDLFNETISAD
jgi:dienelactone hydrolase